MTHVINTILQERAVLPHRRFHVVADKEPICPEHLLIFPYTPCSSLAQLDELELLELEEFVNQEFGQDHWAFFESGNIPFCTSMNGPSYAHAHVVPLRYFHPNLVSSVVRGPSNYASALSLSAALTQASKDSRYLIGGASESRWITTNAESHFEKRYIRSALTNRRIRRS